MQLVVLAIALEAAPLLSADGLAWRNQTSLIPPSVALSGLTSVGVVQLEVRASSGTTSVTQMTVELIGTLDPADVDEVQVWYEPQGGDQLFGTADDDRVDDQTPATQYTFDSGGTAVVAIDPSLYAPFDTSPSRWFYVVLVLESGADVSRTVGAYISDVVHTGGNSTPIPATLSTVGSVDSYAVNVGAATIGIAPASADQGTEDVPVAKIVLEPADASLSSNGINIDSITATLAGTASYADVGVGGVLLYRDNTGGGTIGSLDATDTFLTSASVPLSGTTALLQPVSNIQFTSAVTLFIAVNVAAGADFSHTLGFQIDDPSADINFADVETNTGVAVQYTQEGFVLSSDSIPSAGPFTFQITELVLPDTTPPSVVASSPPNGGTLSALDSPILIYFSEDVQGAANEAGYTFGIVGGGTVDFDVTYSNTGGEYIATLAPTEPLDYETFYTVTVIATAITDYATPTPNDMDANKVITFGTGLEFPVVTEPTVVKNRIVAGDPDQDEMVILIPTPPTGATEKVTVQVFTASGRLVRTFHRNVAYSTIPNSGRIRWDGTNDRGKALGPGLYIVQVRTESYKRALKVMIVR